MKKLSVVIFVLLLSIVAIAQKPKVTKVEPPNWWVGMKNNKVQLMIYGENLSGLMASSTTEGITISATHNLANTNYSFVDLTIDPDADPGKYAIRLDNGTASAVFNYELKNRASKEGKYQGFNKHDVIYLITPDRFANGDTSNDRVEGMLDEYDRSKAGKRHGGDLAGIINHLDYLKDLGVTCLWLNPILENSGKGSYHGYAATDLYKIDARFGSNEDYKALVEEAHKRGIKVIFDHVNNHIGIQHEWMKNLPVKDWVNGSVEDHLIDRHYKYTLFDPYSDDKAQELLRDFWFVSSMPDLNQRNEYVANYLIQNSIWWIEYTGLDGIREDTYPYPDQPFLARWAKEILEEYPDFNIVGEIWNADPAACAVFQSQSPIRRGFDFDTNLPSVMDFALCNAIRDYLAGDVLLSKVHEVFTQDFLYADPDNILTFIDNHDMPRAIFITEAETQELKNRKIKQALTILLTTRGIPQILYATEINMKGGESHVELRADFPGGFPKDERNAFSKSGRTEEENDIFDFTQQLLQLRQQHPTLVDGKFIHFSPAWSRNVYKYLKIGKEKTYLTLINGHKESKEVDLSELAPYLTDISSFKDLITDKEFTNSQSLKLKMEAFGTLVLELKK